MHNLKLSCKQPFKSTKKLFLSVGLFLGLLFLLVIPLFQVPDELTISFELIKYLKVKL